MAMTSACVMFAALFGPYCGLSVSSWTASLSAWLGRAPGLRCSLVWIISVGIVASYSWFMNAPLSVFLLVRFAAYGLLPILLVFAGRGRASAGSTGDGRVLLALAAIWLPSEFRLMAGVHLPAGAPGRVDAARLAIVDLALVLFLTARPLPAIGYTFRIGRADAAAAALAFAAFAAVAVPLGLAIGFIRYSPLPFDPLTWAIRGFAIYFMIALPEELLFRGLLQNLFERHRPRHWPQASPLLLAAVTFGMTHLNNGPAPNVRYAVLATLAGIAYGWVWRRTRKITASALTHAAVDLVWGLMLKR